MLSFSLKLSIHCQDQQSQSYSICLRGIFSTGFLDDKLPRDQNSFLILKLLTILTLLINLSLFIRLLFFTFFRPRPYLIFVSLLTLDLHLSLSPILPFAATPLFSSTRVVFLIRPLLSAHSGLLPAAPYAIPSPPSLSILLGQASVPDMRPFGHLSLYRVVIFNIHWTITVRARLTTQ